MANILPNTKRSLIDKANSRVVIVTSAAAFIVMFSLVATKTLVSQAQYQGRVISAKKEARDQLKTDVTASKSLVTSYKAFVGLPKNVIGGFANGGGPQDGDNAKIILDALPSSYDFPALANSLETLLSGPGLQINSITGTDDELNQVTNISSVAPTAVPMPFQVSVTGDYASIQNLILAFQNSIRPFQIQTMDVSGDQSQLTVNITAQTFFQPAKSLKFTTKVVN